MPHECPYYLRTGIIIAAIKFAINFCAPLNKNDWMVRRILDVLLLKHDHIFLISFSRVKAWKHRKKRGKRLKGCRYWFHFLREGEMSSFSHRFSHDLNIDTFPFSLPVSNIWPLLFCMQRQHNAPLKMPPIQEVSHVLNRRDRWAYLLPVGTDCWCNPPQIKKVTAFESV